MDVKLNPQLQAYIDQQVKAGKYSCATEAMEAAIARLMLDPAVDEIDAQDEADLRLSLEQAQRGELLDAQEVHQRLEQRYLHSNG